MGNIQLLNKQYFCDKSTEALSSTAALESMMGNCSKNFNWSPSAGGVLKKGHAVCG